MRFRRRLIILYVVFSVGLGLVWLRAGQLQVLDGDAWASAAQNQRRQTRRLDAPRGQIISADGVVLAEDAPIFQLTVIPWAWKRKVDGRWQRCGRARCSGCGAIQFPRRSGRLPKTCACKRLLGRGRGPDGRDAYPRGEDQTPGRLERLPVGDVAPLAEAVGLTREALEALADARIDKIEKLVRKKRESLTQDGREPSFLQDRLTLMRRDLMRRPYVIVPRISEEAVRLLRTNEDGRYRGFGVRSALRRHYPLGDLASQLIGYTTQLASAEEYERLQGVHGERITLSTRLGRCGLELGHNWLMHGRPGRSVKELDMQGSFSKSISEVPPQPGRTLRLSLGADATLAAQQILDRWIAGDGYAPRGRPSAGFVLLDAHTGEILIWAEAPRFDLNHEVHTLYDPRLTEAVADKTEGVWMPRKPLDPDQDLESWRLGVVEPAPLALSRVSQIAVEPGSTMKPLNALAMLASGLPLPLANYHCRGPHGNPRCHHHAPVSLQESITVSCNPFYAHSVRDSSNWKVYRKFIPTYLAKYGFGQVPGEEVPGWRAGMYLRRGAYDFPLDVALQNARKRLQKAAAKLPEATRSPVPELSLAIQPGTPGKVGGNPAGLGRTLAAVARWVADKSGARRIGVTVTLESREGSRVQLKFSLRAARRPGWFSVPGLDGGARSGLPPILRNREVWRAGVHGPIERGGTVWFLATFDRKLHRASLAEPVTIRPDDGRNVAIGQGPVLVTPLQMARAVAVIANGGTLIEPHVVPEVGARERRRNRQQVPLDPAHLALVRRGMWGVANTEAGTADRIPEWGRVPATVYSKTGTAQVGGTWRPFGATPEGAPWHHWFVGYAEAPGKRTVAFACVLHARLEDAAGLTAAPATQQILEQWYRSPLSRAVPGSD